MLTSAFALIIILMWFRIHWLKGFIKGQRLAHKYLKQTISDQADLIEQKDHIIGYQTEVMRDQNELVKEAQIDGAEIFYDILKERDNGDL